MDILTGEYELKESYAEIDRIFTHIASARNPEVNHNEFYAQFRNFFVVLATILDKKELLKGISKSCLDEKGKLLKTPNKDKFEEFVKKIHSGYHKSGCR